MKKVSVVIIAKNESQNICDCIKSAALIADDIIVVDAQSTDSTKHRSIFLGAKVITVPWEGYGINRNKGAAIAKNNWVFSLDADERVTPELAQQILSLDLADTDIIYGCKRLPFVGDKPIKHGGWGNNKVYRLYNKTSTQWNLNCVHEKIEDHDHRIHYIKGFLLHYTARTTESLFKKAVLYATLGAEKYHLQGRKRTMFKHVFSPVFIFVKNYIFRLGFLDGNEGLQIAKADAYYTCLKYLKLAELNRATDEAAWRKNILEMN